jgi:predicted ester cyclase
MRTFGAWEASPPARKENTMVRSIARMSLLLLLAGASLRAAAAQTPLLDLEKRNEEVVRRATEAMNRGDLAAYVSYFAEDSKNFDQPIGREGIRIRIDDIFATFPDYRHDILEVVTKGDSVIVRCRVSGTHKGVAKMPVNGAMLVGVAPTQKHFDVQHIHWYKVRDGHIAEHTANRDDIGMMRQLGLLPSPSAK